MAGPKTQVACGAVEDEQEGMREKGESWKMALEARRGKSIALLN